MINESADDLESVVHAAVERLVDDDGGLWGYSAAPRWILAEKETWWLTEPIDGAVAAGRLWHLAPDPAMGVGNTCVQWRGPTVGIGSPIWGSRRVRDGRDPTMAHPRSHGAGTQSPGLSGSVGGNG
jgi:hypothetical protein